jgi:hypothetical protein
MYVFCTTVIDREGLDEASLLELQNQEDLHSLSISIVMWVDCLKTVIDYNSADECVTDSDESMCDGHVLCLMNDNES